MLKRNKGHSKPRQVEVNEEGKDLNSENCSDWVIRLARIGDEAEIANVHINSWREAYRGLLPQDFLDQLPLTFRRRKNWWEKVISEPQVFLIQVVECETGIVGFASFEKGREPEMASFAELSAIYLLEKYKGNGIGFKLLSSGFNQMSMRGFDQGYCWVLEGNPTIRFYEKTGAQLSVKTKEDVIGGKTVREMCYVWENIGSKWK